MQGRHAVPMGMIGVEESSKSRPIRAGVGNVAQNGGKFTEFLPNFAT